MKPSLIALLALAACHPAPVARSTPYDASPDAGMFDLIAHAADEALRSLPPPPSCSGATYYMADGGTGWHCPGPIDLSGDIFGAVSAAHCTETPTDGGRGAIRCVVGMTEVWTTHYDRLDAGVSVQPVCEGGGRVRIRLDGAAPTIWCER
jgi:hypothetical protein